MSKRKTSLQQQPPEPQFIAGQQGGYDNTLKKWRTSDGRFSTQNKVLAQKGDFGFAVQHFPTPISRNFEIVEVALAGGDDYPVPEAHPFSGFANVLRAALQDVQKRRRPDLMSTQIASRMRLGEHFYNTEGDCGAIIDVPVDMLVKEPFVESPDTELRDDIESLLYNLQMVDILAELWRCMRTFGQAYPFEVWDGNELVGIVPLPPLYVHVGYNFQYELSSEMVGAKEWSVEVLESKLHPMMYKTMLQHWNYQPPRSTPEGISLPTEGEDALLTPITDKKYSWYRWAMPQLSRSFRTLTTRIVYEDTVRALIEGHRYQLWLFKLGDPEHPPLPGELTAFKAAIEGLLGERTGNLVWRNSPLEVGIYTPQGLDRLIGNEYYAHLTRKLFRDQGITPRVVSGEMPGTLGGATGGAGGGSTAEVDVGVYLERMRYQSDQITGWLQRLMVKWVRRTSRSIKAAKKTTIRFGPTEFEKAARVESIFSPMYRDGTLPVAVYHEAAGLHPDRMRELKRQEQKERELWLPPVTYAQTVVGPQGEPAKTTQQTEPQGSPDKAGEEMNDMESEPVPAEAEV